MKPAQLFAISRSPFCFGVHGHLSESQIQGEGERVASCGL